MHNLVGLISASIKYLVDAAPPQFKVWWCVVGQCGARTRGAARRGSQRERGGVCILLRAAHCGAHTQDTNMSLKSKGLLFNKSAKCHAQAPAAK